MSPHQAAQTKNNKSCLECRRRKVRCNGNQPCDKCIYYEVPDCQFYPRKRRKLTSQKSRKEYPSVNDPPGQDNQILKKLFPSYSPESLANLSRAELLQKAQDDLVLDSEASELVEVDESSDPILDSDDERQWNEPEEVQSPSVAMCDDVNGLSLSTHRRSYMGISSTRAILRAMFKLNPQLRTISLGRESDDSSSGSQSSQELHRLTPSVDEKTSIDGYFAHIQGIIPILNEDDFRAQYLQGDRSDRPWLALLGMVLVLGSIAAGDPDDKSHEIYYARAKGYFDIELLGMGCLESLQALCLLGGCYCHYINSPNMAHAIMGAAFRIAVGLGLHREPTGLNPSTQKLESNPKLNIRRQVWWGLFCLDTWGSTTLGRPTFGRWDPETMNVLEIRHLETKDTMLLSLKFSQEFCMIATRVQHRFVQLRPITSAEIAIYDTDLQSWYQKLVPMFQNPRVCHTSLASAKYILRNRYWNLRLLLYRPVLLSWANHRVPFESLPTDEQLAVQNCQSIACESIDHIASVMGDLNKVRVWNAVWYLYQSTMVLLLRLIIDPEHAEAGTWRNYIEIALNLFFTMSPWSKASIRSREVLLRIYGTTATLQTSSMEQPPGNFDMLSWDQMGYDTYYDNWPWEFTMTGMNGFDGFNQSYEWMDQGM